MQIVVRVQERSCVLFCEEVSVKTKQKFDIQGMIIGQLR